MPQPVTIRKPVLPHLVNTHKAAELLGRSTATLKRTSSDSISEAPTKVGAFWFLQMFWPVAKLERHGFEPAHSVINSHVVQ
jgi:hypothetical protein